LSDGLANLIAVGIPALVAESPDKLLLGVGLCLMLVGLALTVIPVLYVVSGDYGTSEELWICLCLIGLGLALLFVSLWAIESAMIIEKAFQ
jgi:hypothetical protein